MNVSTDLSTCLASSLPDQSAGSRAGRGSRAAACVLGNPLPCSMSSMNLEQAFLSPRASTGTSMPCPRARPFAYPSCLAVGLKRSCFSPSMKLLQALESDRASSGTLMPRWRARSSANSNCLSEGPRANLRSTPSCSWMNSWSPSLSLSSRGGTKTPFVSARRLALASCLSSMKVLALSRSFKASCAGLSAKSNCFSEGPLDQVRPLLAASRRSSMKAEQALRSRSAASGTSMYASSASFLAKFSCFFDGSFGSLSMCASMNSEQRRESCNASSGTCRPAASAIFDANFSWASLGPNADSPKTDCCMSMKLERRPASCATSSGRAAPARSASLLASLSCLSEGGLPLGSAASM
mmetsp:Transcript_78093/g.220845  ORF Transcript_78093/g.220845 Transcript_78093/m.220845 type:complete len:353 (-) Transcript_78093:156-1214(-)